ncbi:MAG: hypothetical protein GTN89_00800 [Acidobacteria bacterium]|nr:hypothetical protein [Acidobacteriota bacterium]NIM60645.1 hypothetical protein [Acidobacteriota bacterium]NIO57932.1 hypothetical protein [Acidobacteriota bacterium]NIQ28935.1 hypothetical protein [Acidobacteriota bacterium]NIQ83409.1 hypothetical protein [Acidobacteriota bacterium]
MSRRACTRFMLAVLAGACVAPVHGADAVLFEEATSGILELAGHTRLEVAGFNGTVFVRAGKQGELRYSAATRAARKDPHPVALWLRGGTIIFRPVAGQEADEIILNVALSEGVRLDIEQSGGKVQVASLLADVNVRARNSEVDIRGAGEEVAVELEGGTLNLENLLGPATVRGAELSSVQLQRLSGSLVLSLSRSTVNAFGLQVAELDLSETAIDIEGCAGTVSGTAVDSRMSFSKVRGGGTLDLENTPLALRDSRGAFVVKTDAELNFGALGGTLNVTGFGGAVVGDGHAGEVAVDNRDARVALTNIGGPVVVSGDTLQVELKEVANTVKLELVGSQVNAEGVKGGIDVTNEYGDVRVRSVQGLTKIVNRNGNVQALDLSGSANIEAEGPELRVEWRALGRDRDSRIENAGGDLFVVFGAGDGGTIEAKADSIETDLDELKIDGDGQTASGEIGEAKTPTINLEASGRLVVSRGS